MINSNPANFYLVLFHNLIPEVVKGMSCSDSTYGWKRGRPEEKFSYFFYHGGDQLVQRETENEKYVSRRGLGSSGRTLWI